MSKDGGVGELRGRKLTPVELYKQQVQVDIDFDQWFSKNKRHLLKLLKSLKLSWNDLENDMLVEFRNGVVRKWEFAGRRELWDFDLTWYEKNDNAYDIMKVFVPNDKDGYDLLWKREKV